MQPHAWLPSHLIVAPQPRHATPPCLRPPPPQAPPHPISPSEAQTLENSLRSTQFTCIFLATKIADQVHAYGLLCYVLSALTGQRRPVSLQQAGDVELRCLQGLEWRLGPYFGEDPLGDISAELAGLFCAGV
jgi:hypothetical protein